MAGYSCVYIPCQEDFLGLFLLSSEITIHTLQPSSFPHAFAGPLCDTTSASIVIHMFPLLNKRTGGIIGLDLTVSLVTDLCRCTRKKSASPVSALFGPVPV
jgi:hypothetical protein